MLTDHQRLYLLVNRNPTEVDIKLYTNLVHFERNLPTVFQIDVEKYKTWIPAIEPVAEKLLLEC